MANYRKSFNFRSGVQVDNDKFLVDGRGNVGVGTSAPNRSLDVYGSTRVNGLLESSSLNVSLASTFQSLVSVGNSVFFNPTTGIISAISYRGDGSLLANVIAIATDGWVKNAGTLSTSFNVYQGPFTPGVLPVALGPLQVGIGSTIFLVGPNGNIGVGTTIPAAKLEVLDGPGGTIGQLRLRTIGDVGVANTTVFLRLNDANGNAGYFGFGGSVNQLDICNYKAGSIRFGTLNVESGRFDSSGNLLVGAATSTGTASQPLQVTGGAYVSGSVGIGTTNPLQKLSVYGTVAKTSADTAVFALSSNDATNPFQFLISRNSSSVTKPYWAIESVEQNVAYRNLSLLPTGGNVTIGSTLDTGTASQVLQVAGSTYIAGDGNSVGVSIGNTNNTTYPVDIRLSGGTTVAMIRLAPSTATRSAGIIYANSGSSNMWTGVLNSAGAGQNLSGFTAYAGVVGMSAGTTPLILATNATERVRVLDTGEVGIGLTNPTEKLQVSGNILVTGTGIVTATTFVGTLVGIATTSLNLANAANITTGTINDARLPDLITSNISAITGISTVNKLRSETIGVGTDSFTSDLAIVKDASVSLELISKTGSASIGLGSEAIGNNNTARIKYNPLTQVLDFDNNGSGEINFHVHKGTGAVVGTQTGGFYFKTGSASQTLMNMSWDGRVSVNETVPILTDKEYSLMVNGNIKGRGRLDLDYGINAGISTFASLYVTGISTFNSGQNFNTSSGISSFWTFNVRNFLNVTGVSSFIGIATFLGNVAIGSSTAITNSPFQIYSPTTLTRSSLGLGTSKIYYDYVGGITTGFTDPRDQVKLSGLIGSPGKKISAFGYGDYQIRTGGLNIICADSICIHPSLAVTTTGSWEGLSVNENSDMGLKYANGGNLPMIGINTLFARSIVDVGYAVTSMNSYFIPPRLTTTEIYYVSQLWNPDVAGAAGWFNHTRANTSTPNGVVSGAIVFDTTASQLKVGIGTTTFCGIATFTNNHTGFSAFVPPKLTTAQRDTMTTVGISSGAIIWNLSAQRLEVRDSHNSRWYGIGTVV